VGFLGSNGHWRGKGVRYCYRAWRKEGRNRIVGGGKEKRGGEKMGTKGPKFLRWPMAV